MAEPHFFQMGRPEPDVSTWEGRMSMRARARAEIAALTEPPPEQDETDSVFGFAVGYSSVTMPAPRTANYPIDDDSWQLRMPGYGRESISIRLPDWAGLPLIADWQPDEGERIDVTEALSLELDDSAVRFDFKHPVVPLGVWGEVSIYGEMAGRGPHLIWSWRMRRVATPTTTRWGPVSFDEIVWTQDGSENTDG